MTERLYYTDPFCIRFEGRVTRIDEAQGRPAAVLDRTAFYPASGGQPFDTGTLEGVRVEEVLEQEDGTVLHVLERAIPPGQVVHGEIDWARRFDHMQQHTGQHVLSAAFDRLHRARTVGFHLGAVVSTIDLARDLPPPAVEEAETESNRVVWEDRPVAVRFATEEEAARMPLRKEPERGGLLRLVEVADFDLSACGGTHVTRTGAIGIIAVLSSERFRGGLRLEFVCGGRALRSLRTLRDSVAGSITHLSVLPEELPAAIERAQAENKDLRRTLRKQQEQLAGFEAAAMAARGRRVGERTQVVEALEGWDAAGLKTLAASVAANPGFDVILISADTPALAVVACAPGGAADAAAVLRALLARFGGKGGGKRDLAQGGGLTGPIPEMLEAARQELAGAGSHER